MMVLRVGRSPQVEFTILKTKCKKVALETAPHLCWGYSFLSSRDPHRAPPNDRIIIDFKEEEEEEEEEK